MSKLLELAGRCEKAEGPDRELDRDIMLIAVPCDRAPFRYWTPMNENTGHGEVDLERVYYGPHCAQAVAVPSFTASLDAAMPLVPEGYLMAITNAGTQNPREPDFSRASAVCADWRSTDSEAVEAATLALALCAAALRARASQEDQSQAVGV